MTLTLRILLILSSVLASCTVIRRIRKSKMQIDDAVFWVLFSLVLIVLAVFPHTRKNREISYGKNEGLWKGFWFSQSLFYL